MKKILRISGMVLGLLCMMVFTLFPVMAHGAEFRAGDQPKLDSSETVKNDLYIAGGTVNSLGKVVGDLTAAGGNLLVSGGVSEDINIAGGTIIILGDVGGGIRGAGGNVTIKGAVGGDIVVAGGQIQIIGDRVGRDVVVAGGSVEIDSPVSGNVRFTGGKLVINAPVLGNVEANGEEVTLGSAAVISGNLTYKATKEATLAEGAKVMGKTNYTPRVIPKNTMAKGLAAFLTIVVLAKFVSMLVGSLILGLTFKRYTAELVERAFTNPWAELGRGLVFSITLPILSLILLVTLIGIPFGILGFLSLVAILIVSSFVAPILFGSLLHKWIKKGDGYVVSWKTILLGTVVSFVITAVPVLGGLVLAGFTLISIGVVVKTKWEVLKGWK
jgi:hypothetical protein